MENVKSVNLLFGAVVELCETGLRWGKLYRVRLIGLRSIGLRLTMLGLMRLSLVWLGVVWLLMMPDLAAAQSFVQSESPYAERDISAETYQSNRRELSSIPFSNPDHSGIDEKTSGLLNDGSGEGGSSKGSKMEVSVPDGLWLLVLCVGIYCVGIFEFKGRKRGRSRLSNTAP